TVFWTTVWLKDCCPVPHSPGGNMRQAIGSGVFDLRPAGDAPVRWETPDGAQSVSLNSQAIVDLRSHVIEGFLSVPKRGAEVGGLLLGRVAKTDPLAIAVEAIEPVHCEHRHGPSFVLSESDRSELERTLSRHRDDGVTVVGF